MASIFGHAVATYGFSKLYSQKVFTTKVLLLGILSSVLPDIDVIAFNYGITDDHILGHRGITHSIVFGLVWAYLLTLLFHIKDNHKYVIYSFYTVSTISHGVLDAMTTGGSGIAFFYPLTSDRYFLPFRIIEVSPIGASHFFSKWGLEVLISEAKTIGVMALLFIILGRILNKQVYK